VEGQYRFNGFDFHDDTSADQEIDTVRAVDEKTAISKRN
jgi:hypothetical protein